MNQKRNIEPSQSESVQDNFQDCVCFELRRTMRLVTQLYDARFQSTGMRSTQFPILAGLLRGPCSLSTLASTLTLEHSTLVRSIRPLVDAGYITLSPGEDRRVKIAALTEEGQQKVQEIAPLWRETQGELVETLSEENWADLKSQLKSIRKLIFQSKDSPHR